MRTRVVARLVSGDDLDVVLAQAAVRSADGEVLVVPADIELGEVDVKCQRRAWQMLKGLPVGAQVAGPHELVYALHRARGAEPAWEGKKGK